MRTPWTGCGTALVTPFARDGSIDETAVRRLARRQIDAGIHFLVPCGTTGESPTLTEDERVRVVELVVDEASGRVPVLAGAGGYDTKEVVSTARRMKQVGASGILSVTPYYNKPTQEGLYQHYSMRHREIGVERDRLLQEIELDPGAARAEAVGVEPQRLEGGGRGPGQRDLLRRHAGERFAEILTDARRELVERRQHGVLVAGLDGLGADCRARLRVYDLRRERVAIPDPGDRAGEHGLDLLANRDLCRERLIELGGRLALHPAQGLLNPGDREHVDVA